MMMRQNTKKKAATLIPTEEGPLQNPDAKRQLIVPACIAGGECHKIFVDDDSAVCRAYLNPAEIQDRMGSLTACGIKQKLGDEETVKKFVNPIKASKRGLG